VARVRLIGCGNPDAGDDALGLIAVREARPLLAAEPDVEIVEARAALGVLDLLGGVDAVVVVDAVRDPSGRRPPGTLVRAEAGAEGLPAELRSSLSSHGLGVAEAVGLAAAVGDIPRVVFLGVEVAEVTAGAPLSPRVVAELPDLIDRVVAETKYVAKTLGS
jgi:hydrogenase maturation protease